MPPVYVWKHGSPNSSQTNLAHDSSADKRSIEYYNNYRIKLLNASATEIAKLPSFSRIKANQIKSFITKNPNCSLKDIVSKIDFSELQILILKYCTLLELGEEQTSETEEFKKCRITYDQPLNQT